MRRRFLLAVAADLIRPILGAINARRAWRELGGRVDWVYERHSAFDSLGWLFKRRGVPWILETNGPLFYEAKEKTINVALLGLVRWLEIRTYKRCDIIVCISETLKEIVVREAGVPSAKVVAIPNAVDPAVFNPESCEPKRIFEGFTVGFVGSLEPWQGLELLIEALSELRAAGLKISVVVVGDGPMRVAWEALARQLGVSEHVAFVGKVQWQEVPKFIAGFDLGYCGKVEMKEGEMYHSPLKLYEYMAMAKPVLASEFEGASQVIRDEETGFLFRTGNKEDLERVLTRAYKSWSKLTEMGSKAREEVASKHNWLARVSAIISTVEDRVESLR